jgi:hypothetical protein
LHCVDSGHYIRVVVLWWIGNLILLAVVTPTVIMLANRVIRRAVEIRKYADDILEHGVGLAGNLDPVPALGATAESISRVKGLAVRYLGAAGKLL